MGGHACPKSCPSPNPCPSFEIFHVTSPSPKSMSEPLSESELVSEVLKFSMSEVVSESAHLCITCYYKCKLTRHLDTAVCRSLPKCKDTVGIIR